MNTSPYPYSAYQQRTVPVVCTVLCVILSVDLAFVLFVGTGRRISLWADLASLAVMLPFTVLTFVMPRHRRNLAASVIAVAALLILVRAQTSLTTVLPDILYLSGLALISILVAYEILGIAIGLITFGYLITATLLSPGSELSKVVYTLGFLVAGFTVVSVFISREIHRNLKRIEELGRESEKHKAAVRESERAGSLGLLAARMAHEMNTPLGTALTAVSHIADHPEDGENQKLAEAALGMIRRSVDTLNRLRDMAPIEEALTGYPADLSAVLNEEAAQALPPCTARGVRPELILEAPTSLEVNTQVSVFRRIVRELLHNALIHAFPESMPGRKPRVTISLSRRENQLTLSVSDNGIGMKGREEALMEPLSRVMNRSGSLGVGLTTVALLVHQVLGGRLTVESPGDGEGTQATVSFPVTS